VKEAIKRLLQRTRLYSHLLAWRNTRGQRTRCRRWLSAGRESAAPHLGKQAAIRELPGRFGLQVRDHVIRILPRGGSQDAERAA